jgi:hypothetical protein
MSIPHSIPRLQVEKPRSIAVRMPITEEMLTAAIKAAKLQGAERVEIDAQTGRITIVLNAQSPPADKAPSGCFWRGGMLYGRARIAGKLYRQSMETVDPMVARERRKAWARKLKDYLTGASNSDIAREITGILTPAEATPQPADHPEGRQ